MTKPVRRLYGFGPFVLDPQERRLLRDGKPVKLTDKAFDILHVLVQESGHLLTKDQLIARVWPDDKFVEEGNLSRNVSTLRTTLGERSGKPQYIETVPKHGYRFVADLRELVDGMDTAIENSSAVEAQGNPPAEPNRTIASPEPLNDKLPLPRSVHWPLGRPRILVPAVVSVLLIVGLAFRFSRLDQTSASANRIHSIAVLPFQNLSGDPNQEFFSDGTTEVLISNLAQIHSIDVISRTSSMRYKGSTKTIREIGRELGVDAILEGSVQRSGERVRITAQLIRVSTETHLWAKNYDRNLSDLLQLQAEVAQAVVHEIQAQITPEETRRLAKVVALDPAVQDSYLLGRHHLAQGGIDNFKKAVEYFEQVIALKPDYAPAYVSLSSVRGYLDNSIPQPEEAIRIPAEKAVELDADLGEAHAALASARFHAWKWADADAEFKRALELNPDSGYACSCYGVFLAAMGRFPEAFEILDHGVKTNPVSAEVHGNYAFVAFFARRYDDAITHAQRALELEPQSNSRLILARTYQQIGKSNEAVILLDIPAFRGSAYFAGAYAAAGRTSEAWKIVNSITRGGGGSSALALSRTYFRLGDKEHGFEWLARSLDRKEGPVRFIRLNPEFDEIRNDPRFQALVARLKLPN